MLRQWMEPQLTKRAKRATKKGADTLKPHLKAAVRPYSKRAASAVYVHVAKRNRPAHVLGARRRKAYFWHWIIGGTKDHGPRKYRYLRFIPNWNPYMNSSPRAGVNSVRASRVRGVPAHPVVSHVAERYGEQAFRAMIDDLSRED